MTNLSNLHPYLAKPNALAKVERELATRSFREFVARRGESSSRRRSSSPDGTSTPSVTIWKR